MTQPLPPEPAGTACGAEIRTDPRPWGIHGFPHTCVIPAGSSHTQHACTCGRVWTNERFGRE